MIWIRAAILALYISRNAQTGLSQGCLLFSMRSICRGLDCQRKVGVATAMCYAKL
jgi:hypothetical protein